MFDRISGPCHSYNMAMILELPADLLARIDAITARYGLSPSDIIADALKNGRTLEWQERYLDQVAEGLAAADLGEFATPADLARVVNKHRPK